MFNHNAREHTRTHACSSTAPRPSTTTSSSDVAVEGSVISPPVVVDTEAHKRSHDEAVTTDAGIQNRSRQAEGVDGEDGGDDDEESEEESEGEEDPLFGLPLAKRSKASS